MTAGPVAIAGTGQAGFQVAASLRQHGHEGEIVLIGDEPGLPYQRPPLSKAYLKEGRAERLLLRNDDFYEKNRIELIDRARIERIDRRAGRVLLADGGSFAYTHLVLATGARNRGLPIEGTGLGGVLQLRTLADADAIRERLDEASHAVVIGGGFIGLEFSAVARAAGIKVTVIEAMPRVMARAVSEPVSRYFSEFHAGIGVAIETGAMASRLADDGTGRVGGVELADGRSIGCDMVVVAAGVMPNQELAAEAGLATANGIVVGETLLTEDPAISAVGDCAAFVFPRTGKRVRLESVQNAVDQAKCVAARLTGSSTGYDALPWFWSDQGDRKLQIAGLTDDADDRVVVDGENGRLCVHCFREDNYIGLESVNSAGDHMMARRLLGAGRIITKRELAKKDFDLRAFRDR